MPKVGENSTALNKIKTGCVQAVKLYVSNRTVQELFIMVLIKSVAFAVFETLQNLFSMKKVLGANNC